MQKYCILPFRKIMTERGDSTLRPSKFLDRYSAVQWGFAFNNLKFNVIIPQHQNGPLIAASFIGGPAAGRHTPAFAAAERTEP
jgi:hypothetical protein